MISIGKIIPFWRHFNYNRNLNYDTTALITTGFAMIFIFFSFFNYRKLTLPEFRSRRFILVPCRFKKLPREDYDSSRSIFKLKLWFGGFCVRHFVSATENFHCRDTFFFFFSLKLSRTKLNVLFFCSSTLPLFDQ